MRNSYQSSAGTYSSLPFSWRQQVPQKWWCLRKYTASYLNTLMFTRNLKSRIAAIRLWKQLRMPQEIWKLFLVWDPQLLHGIYYC